MTSYRLLDSGSFLKYEQIGEFRIIRPSPQAVWKPHKPIKDWKKKVDAVFERYSEGKGEWIIENKKISAPFSIQINDVEMGIKLTPFGHLGVFFEQVHEWKNIQSIIEERIAHLGTIKVLNLFAYTGGATLHCLKAGAEVVHLDASKTSVAWAKDNLASSQLNTSKVRWIVDDVQKFVQKEVRRGNTYNAIIMDPPSFGRGSQNEVWKIEEHLVGLLEDIQKIMSKDLVFIQLSSHSPGYTPIALENLVKNLCSEYSGTTRSEEMVITDEYGKRVPSGAQSFFLSTK